MYDFVVCMYVREQKFGPQLKNEAMMIHDIKYELILQDSSQDPSMSSKYDFSDGRFFIHF